MIEPSKKAPNMTAFLESLSGRSTAINHSRCIAPPFGCGGLATHFTDPLSAREYSITGMCQNCQDGFFKEEVYRDSEGIPYLEEPPALEPWNEGF